MKKTLLNLIVIVLLIFPISVFASGSISVSPSSLTIEVGSTKTFTISATNTIGDVEISSSNSSIASVSTNEWGTGMVDEGQTKTGTITVNGKSIGTTTITLTIDAATFDGEDLAGQKRTISVNVVAKPEPTTKVANNNNTNNNTVNDNSNNNVSNSNVNTINVEDNRSKNNRIKDITIDGFELTKVDANNYTLTVGNDVDSINVNATAEDTKSKVSGTGVHELNIGENKIEIIVTSESGLKNKITITVNRKDAYYLDDLESALNNDKLGDINININNDSIITSEDLIKIKNSGKKINFNYISEDKLLYTWIIDGTKIKNTDELLTTILYESNNKKEIYKLSNYADGLYISINDKTNIPDGTKIKLYVGDKFDNGNIVNIYSYIKNNTNLELLINNLKVENGYIEFAIDKDSDYFITMSTITNSNKETNQKNTSTNTSKVLIITFIILLVIVLTVLTLINSLKTKRYNN